MSPVKILTPTLCALFVSVALGQSADPAGTDPRQLNVVQSSIAAVAAPQSNLKVDVWLDRASGLYSPGDKARIFVRTNQDAYLTVLNVNAKGETLVIFPNTAAPNNQVKAQTVVELGKPGGAYELVLSEPYGANLLKVVASTTRQSVLGKAQTASTGVFTEVKSAPQELARQINVVVNEQPQAAWNMNQVVFAVVPRTTLGAPVTATPAPVASTPAAPVASTPAFTLPALESAFAIDLRTGKSTYKPKEAFSLQVTPEKDCSLSLVSFSPDGTASVLYPNNVVKDVRLKAGRTTFLPTSGGDLKLTVGGTPGVQSLVAVCTPKVGFFASLFRSNDREVFPTVATQDSVSSLLSGGKGEAARASVNYTITVQ